MCSECWRKHYGGVKKYSPEIDAAVEAIAKVYEHTMSGGHLHIVVDDFNLEDDSLAFCRRELKAPLMADETQEKRDAEEACLDLLEKLSVEDRAAALALHDGYFSRDECTNNA